MSADSSAASAPHKVAAPAPPVRHEIGMRALVAGLAPVVLPLVIRHLEQGHMALAYESNADQVDERWASIGAGVMVIFKIDAGEQRQRITVHGQLRQRDAEGIDVRLVALDEATIAALRSLVAEAQAKRERAAAAPARQAAAAQLAQQTRSRARAACEVTLSQQIGAPLTIYLGAFAAALQQLQAQAQTPAEQKKYDGWSATFAKARPQLNQALMSVVSRGFASFLHETPKAGDRAGDLLSGGLSLMESTDLRASLAVAEAISRLVSQVENSWHTLAQRLAQISHVKPDDCILAPALLCHQFAEVIGNDAQLGTLHQFDLSIGFSDGFAARLEQLYQSLNTLLERVGVHAPKADSRKLPGGV